MSQPAPVSFSRGSPSADLLPVEAVRAASEKVLTEQGTQALAYGSRLGYPRLREALAERHDVDPDQILVTNGSLQAVAFIAELYSRSPQPRVALEAPTYDRSLVNFVDRGYTIDSYPVEADGMDVEALVAGPTPDLVYTIPTFQNPAGSTMPAAKRKRFADWARERDVVVFEDDPYRLLRFTGEDVPPLRDFAPGQVLWATSFTKTVAPGLRTGYVVIPEARVDALAEIATNTYISPSFLPQAIIAELLTNGEFEATVAHAKQALGSRLKALCAALDRELPDASYVRPEGGYFLWLQLPEGVTAAELNTAASERNVALVPGTDFFPPGSGMGTNAVRLAFSAADEEMINQGVARLAEAVQEVRNAGR